MENFIFSLNATAPIFLVMILGNILMKTGFLSEEFTRVSDKFVFRWHCLPCCSMTFLPLI